MCWKIFQSNTEEKRGKNTFFAGNTLQWAHGEWNIKKYTWKTSNWNEQQWKVANNRKITHNHTKDLILCLKMILPSSRSLSRLVANLFYVANIWLFSAISAKLWFFCLLLSRSRFSIEFMQIIDYPAFFFFSSGTLLFSAISFLIFS